MVDFENGFSITIADSNGEIYGYYHFGQYEARHLLTKLDGNNSYVKELDIDCQGETDTEDCVSDICQAATACIKANPVVDADLNPTGTEGG